MKNALKRFCLCFAALSLIFGAFPSFAAEEDAPKFFRVVEFEEMGEDGKDISVFDKKTCGGEKYAVINSSAEIKADFELEEGGKYLLWVRLRNTGKKSNEITYKLDGKGSAAIFAKESAAFSWKKAELGELESGAHTLSFSADSEKLLDQLVITEQASFRPSGTYKNEETSAAQKSYMPGRPELEEDESIAFFEEKNGSWVIQAEDANLENPIYVYEQDLANGEKYISAKLGLGRNLTPEQNKNPHAQWKIKVSQKADYKLWVRYYSPNSGQKSSFFSIDNSPWREINTGSTTQYKWANAGIYSLDEGYHAINFQYREAGQRIDCFILTSEMDYWPSGLGNYPGEEPIPDNLTYAERLMPRVYVGGEELKSNTNIQKINGRYMIPAELFCETMGIDYEKTENGVIMSKGRNYIKFTADSAEAVANGEKVSLAAKPFYVQDAFLSDLDLICETFGIKYETEDGIKLYFSPVETEEFSESSRLDVYGRYIHGYGYKIENVSENARAIGYIKTDSDKCWRKGTTAFNKGGTIYGSFIDCEARNKAVIKVKLIENGKAEYLYKTAEGAEWCPYPTVNSFIPHGDGITLRPTFENMSYYLDVDSDKYAAKFYYREKGEENFREAYEPYFDDLNLQYRGSIVGLKEGTEYEVKAVLEKSGRKTEISAFAKTETSDVPIAKEIKFSELSELKDKNGSYVFDNYSGTADGWIKIVADGGELTPNTNAYAAIYVLNSHYLIFEGLKVKGGERCGFLLTNGSDNIRVINCDISGFGKYGVVPEGGGIHNDYKNENINNDSGVFILNVGNILVERCYIHDPKGRTNHWGYGHPCGMNAIFVRGTGGVVIRNNDFVGSDEARWNDAIECFGNGTINGGISNDSDIYGNLLVLGADDSTEFDDAQMNVRFYGNRIEQFLCGISTVPQMVGPSYIFRNLFTNMGDPRGANYNATKNGGGEGRRWNYGLIYFFNNTAYTTGSSIGSGGFTGAEDDVRKRIVSRNNILLSGTAKTSYAIDDTVGDPAASYDYDVICRTDGSEAAMVCPEGNEKHGVFALPEFVSHANGLYALTQDSPAIDKGTKLNNFTDGYEGNAPDIGALEYNGNSDESILKRNVDITADKYTLFVKNGERENEITLKIGSGIKEGTKYSIKINELDEWYSAENEEGTTEGELKPGTELKIKVKTDTSKNKNSSPNFANGCILIRLENGLSVPITVYNER